MLNTEVWGCKIYVLTEYRINSSLHALQLNGWSVAISYLAKTETKMVRCSSLTLNSQVGSDPTSKSCKTPG